jgi:hypothetical protein
VVEAECGGAASLERSFSADFASVYAGTAERMERVPFELVTLVCVIAASLKD